MTITNPPSVTSEKATKHPSNVPKEFTIAKPRNTMIEYSSRYTTGAPSTMTTDLPSSNTRYQKISELDAIKRGSHEVQVGPKINIIMFILYII